MALFAARSPRLGVAPNPVASGISNCRHATASRLLITEGLPEDDLRVVSTGTDATQALRYAALAFTRPLEFKDRVTGRRERERMERAQPLVAEVVASPVAAAHEIVGQPRATCCGEVAEVRTRTLARLHGNHHHDAGSALAEILWVVVRHTQPKIAVETGVARGISSAFILDAMARNGDGHLFSVDLPPMTPGWNRQSGAAVAPDLRSIGPTYAGAPGVACPGSWRRCL